jgi:hypothetical protein
MDVWDCVRQLLQQHPNGTTVTKLVLLENNHYCLVMQYPTNNEQVLEIFEEPNPMPPTPTYRPTPLDFQTFSEDEEDPEFI